MTTDAGTHDRSYVPIAEFQSWIGEATERDGRIESAHRRLSDVVNALEGDNVRSAALSQVLDGAALETGAIEGLYRSTSGVTISVIDGTIALSTATAELMEDVDVQALVEGQRAAYDLALDVVTGAQPISEALVRRIHQTACRGQATHAVRTAIGMQQQPLLGGSYKQNPNHVRLQDGTVHAYCPVLDVAAEMERLIKQTTAASFLAASAVTQAAYLHHSLTHIHPFSDGNGRAARVLASIPLLRSHSVPLVVFADRDGAYRSTQADADRGNTQAFISFVEDSVFEVMNLVAQRLETDVKRRPDLDELAARIASRSTREPKLAADRLLDVVKSVGPEVATMLDLPSPFRVHFGVHGTATINSGNSRSPLVQAGKSQPFAVDLGPNSPTNNRGVGVFFDPSGGQDSPLVVRARKSKDFEARVDEVLPRVTMSLRARLRAWLEGVALDMLSELDAEYQ